ncbi:MAG: TatD family hydrolase, partial [Pseudomonadota bacterium]
MSLIDSHIHLDFPAFDPDREQVMARAAAVGVSAFVVPGVTERGWSAVHRLYSSSTRCFAGYGLHPCYLDAHSDGCVPRLDQWLDTHAAVAVGECGLDYYLNDPQTQAQQLALFDGQIDIAALRRLPLIVHARRAVDQVTQRLRRREVSGGVIHSFSGSWQQACKLIDLGFHIGIGGAVTHSRAKK